MHLSPAVVPRLQEALGSRDPPVARCAVILLGNIGPGARAAIPALVKALQTAGPVEPLDNLTGKSATLDIAETITRVAPLDEAVAALTGALRSPSRQRATRPGPLSPGSGPRPTPPFLSSPPLSERLPPAETSPGAVESSPTPLPRLRLVLPSHNEPIPKRSRLFATPWDLGTARPRSRPSTRCGGSAHRAAPAIPALRALTSKAIGDPDHSPVEIRRAVDFALEKIEGEHHAQEKINP